MQVTRYSETNGDPDRLSIMDGGVCLLDVSMSGDSPFRPHLSSEVSRPWFYTGSPHGGDILQFAKDVGIIST